MERRLYRSRSDRVIWGVCGGLAKYLNVDPVVIRLVMVLLVFANGIGILAYIIMAVIVPLEGSKTAQPRETIRENSPSPTFGEKEVEAEDRDEMLKRHRNFAGIVLILVGLFFLAENFNFFWWFDWDSLWPLLLVAVGLVLILNTWRR